MIGKTISHYRILQKIGAGGMGEVYLAEDTMLERKVALKFLPVQFSADEEERKRFIHEAKAASALDHPNICTVHEIGQAAEGALFIAMGYYEGKTLKEKMKDGSLPIPEALEIAIQIAEGLKKAHGKGIVHRDIKPANIFITNENVVKILDFGIAKLAGGQTKLTKTGTTVGTAAYMSPEQAQGKKIDQRTDIWSLGVVLYEMLAGKSPFQGEYEQAVVYSIINEAPKPLAAERPGIPADIERFIGKTLAKDPASRYPGMGDFLADLRSIAAGPNPAATKSAAGRILGIPKIFLYAVAALLAAAFVFFVGPGRNIFHKKPSSAPIRSLAVLPLANYSGDPAQEYFSDGMTDALIAGLAQIKSIKVISRTSVAQYKDTKKPLPKIAAELNVEGIIEGSVMRSGNRVRITAQLIDSRQDRHLWASHYEREMSDVLRLQSEVVQAIAGEIRAQLTPVELKRLKSPRTVDPKSYEAYLMGRFYWNKQTVPAFDKSIEYFQKAIAWDPQNAAAYVGLVDAYSYRRWRADQPLADFASKERQAALKAIEIDDDSSEAHMALGTLKLDTDWDWEGAVREYKRAIELNPSNAYAHLYCAQTLYLLCRQEEAVAAAERANELDPMNPQIALYRYKQLGHSGRFDDALAGFGKLRELFPDFLMTYEVRGQLYGAKGMYEEAIADAKAAILQEDTLQPVATLGYFYAKAGRRAEALKVLDRMHEESKRSYVPPTHFAIVYAGLGDWQKTFASLEKAYLEHYCDLAFMLTFQAFNPCHNDPRFRSLMSRMNLPICDRK